MNSMDGYPFRPERVWLDREVEGEPRTIRVMERLASVPVEVVDDIRALKRITDLSLAKREWILTKHRGRAFKPCQGMPHEDEHICCGYHVIDLVSGCPMNCSYCILQHYLENNPRTTIYVNIDEVCEEVRTFLKLNASRFFRIGTGELSDSLALDPITGHAGELIPFFAQQENAVLELKTKTDFVDHLLDLPHGGHTVIAWSLNTERIARHEERGAASLERRLNAASSCVQAGYRVGFHFDPVVMNSTSGEELAEYADVIDRMFDAVQEPHIAWVSLGLLRLPYAMKELIRRRFPDTTIFGGELVPAGNKMRYARFLRADFYRPLWKRLTRYLPPEKVYLCMETREVWQKLGVTSQQGMIGGFPSDRIRQGLPGFWG